MWYTRPLTEESLFFLHERVIENDPSTEDGYTSKGLVESCMDRAVGDFFGEAQYQNIFGKTAALIQGIVNFHPFTDGNKRTALLAANFFLLFHGYKLNIVYEDVLDTFVDIANEEITDVKTIADWVEKNSNRMGVIPRFLIFLMRLRLNKIDLVAIFGETGETRIITNLLKRIGQVWPE